MASSNVFFRPGLRPLAKVYLKDVHDREAIFLRTIQVTTPTIDIKIGRGSQTEAQLHPQSTNAWFTSRVMSREHAVLQVDQPKKQILLSDAESMHGTYLDGKRLEQGEKAIVTQGQRIQFGTEIVRGDQTYKPLEVSLQVEWADDFRTQPRFPHLPASATSNTFSSDYSDEDDDDGEDDVEIVYESIRIPDNERQPRTFSVPESDESDSSIMDKNTEESAPSSPLDPAKSQGDTAATLPVIINATTMANPTIDTTTQPNEAVNLPGSSMDSALDVSDDDDNEVDLEQQEEHFSDSSENDDYASSCGDEDYDNEDVPYSELDDDLEEAENDKIWGKAPPQLNPKDTSNRAPSPSDAAMPKPSWYNSNLGQLDHTTSQPEYNPFQPQHANSQLRQVMSPYQTYGCYYPTTWSGNAVDSFAEPYRRYDELPNRLPNDYGLFRPQVYGLNSAIPQRVDSGNVVGHADNTPKVTSNAATTTENTDVNDSVPKPKSKVSINDIIDSVTSESNTRKRKADDISTSISKEENNLETVVAEADITVSAVPTEVLYEDVSAIFDAFDNIAVVENNLSSASEKKKTVMFSPDAVIIEPEPETETERLQKRVKVAHKEGSNFFKYAATAAAGMAVGAIGTVFGLVALPAEYFA